MYVYALNSNKMVGILQIVEVTISQLQKYTEGYTSGFTFLRNCL